MLSMLFTVVISFPATFRNGPVIGLTQRGPNYGKCYFLPTRSAPTLVSHLIQAWLSMAPPDSVMLEHSLRQLRGV